MICLRVCLNHSSGAEKKKNKNCRKTSRFNLKIPLHNCRSEYISKVQKSLKKRRLYFRIRLTSRFRESIRTQVNITLKVAIKTQKVMKINVPYEKKER